MADRDELIDAMCASTGMYLHDAERIVDGGIDLGGGRRIAIIEPARWSDEDGDGWRVMLSDSVPADIDLSQEPDVDFVPDDENWLTYDVPLFRIVTPNPEEA